MPAVLRVGDSFELNVYRLGNHLLLDDPPSHSSIFFGNSVLSLSSARPAISLMHALASRGSLPLAPLEFQICYQFLQHLPLFAPLSRTPSTAIVYAICPIFAT